MEKQRKLNEYGFSKYKFFEEDYFIEYIEDLEV